MGAFGVGSNDGDADTGIVVKVKTVKAGKPEAPHKKKSKKDKKGKKGKKGKGKGVDKDKAKRTV